MTQMRTQQSLRCGQHIKLPLMWQNQRSVMCKRIALCDVIKLIFFSGTVEDNV